MEIYRSYQSIPKQCRTAVAIGNFDGLHLGHRVLLRHARDEAERLSVDWAVLTFSPHPTAVLAPNRAPLALMDDEQKATGFAQLGVERVLFQDFSSAFAHLSPVRFVDEVLVDGLGAEHVVVGFDFRYGQGRAGTTETLRSSLACRGVGLTVVNMVAERETKISSSEIRRAIQAADLSYANRLLGWSYGVVGVVEHGDARGRKLGFPTLNLNLEGRVHPGEGVYCGWLQYAERTMPAVANLGTRPTVGGAQTERLEVHIMNERLGDLYGAKVRFVFHSRIRAVHQFADVAALKAQIAMDAEAADVRLCNCAPVPIALDL